ncbi:asparagine synthase (glutamine-hydrolyzing) [Salinirubellus salinus]|uniref:Putative asparagine synthetase [glutamine-hydrolyzing] n=2 Tax=Salinirubellus salinus TaxID=1364945 RepID=A0A9E7QZC4_9EURY|nr:asparagine synthase (glutamine-hydrolyzing) [Salinirubellus salinus]UWM52752.1 asparagine synthase (glutamine-hydrolyzing) [Salinirubellus salinus]
MNACLAHRGPDDSGIFRDGPVGLAHTRLSIIDLSTGKQPIFNEDETVSVVFNGEIYNYRSLRSSLSNAGHTFSTKTDTEVLVHLYEEHGPSFVDRLKGMFAFALWDHDDERLLLARDPLGIKPLLLADDGDRIAFASELPALLESGVNHGGVNRQSISQYFALGYIPASMTAFRNIRKLRPGEQVIVSEEGVEQRQFYTPTINSRDVSFDTAVNGLRDRLEDAVEERLMSDVPLGAFLSGGIDSSIIVGLMTDLSDSPVRTFTVGFEESRFDESWAAREVAEYHDTDHTEYTVSPSEVRDAIPNVLGQLGEPFADQSLLPTYAVSRETSRDVKVALSGDGADELFAGYSRYRGEYYANHYRRIPSTVRTSLLEPVVNRLDVSRRTTRGELVRKGQKFLGGGEPDPAIRHFEWARVPDDEAAVTFDQIAPVEAGRQVLKKQHEAAGDYLPTERQDELATMLAVDTQFGLPNQILHKTDLASMQNSLEVRVPFVDTDVVEYAMSLPTEYKITPRKQKRVLKRAFDDLLPKPILERGKQGFDMPIGEWLKDDLYSEFRETVTSIDTDLFDTRGVLSVLDNHRTGAAEHGKFLWSVYVFARWHRQMTQRGVI